MDHILPAAAVKEGSTVILGDELAWSEEFIIDHLENSTPKPGKITWRNKNGVEVVVGGNERIKVVKLPE